MVCKCEHIVNTSSQIATPFLQTTVHREGCLSHVRYLLLSATFMPILTPCEFLPSLTVEIQPFSKAQSTTKTSKVRHRMVVRSLSFALSGSGWLIPYHLGVMKSFEKFDLRYTFILPPIPLSSFLLHYLYFILSYYSSSRFSGSSGGSVAGECI